ncbi:MAG: DUF86 domain-containing protein [Thermodesulfobacteriota bacterium]
MTPSKISKRVVGDRLDWLDKMVTEINSLPLKSYEEFISDSRNVWAAESCLRRALEALFDLGRHILAKCFGKGVSEYKEIASELEKERVFPPADAKLLRTLAGYRNRLVHFYHNVTTEELYKVCKNDLGDILAMKDAYLKWLKRNPDKLDEML